MPHLFNSHKVTLALIAAIMLLLEIAQPRPRLLADELASDQASTQVIKSVTKSGLGQNLPPSPASEPAFVEAVGRGV